MRRDPYEGTNCIQYARRPDFTPLLRVYTRYRRRQLGRQDPVESQRRELRRLLAKAKDTRFGREHGFAGIDDVSAYQAAVPLRGYEAMWEEFWKPTFPRLLVARHNPLLRADLGNDDGHHQVYPVLPRHDQGK